MRLLTNENLRYMTTTTNGKVMRADDRRDEQRGPSVKAFVRPYNYWYDFYQAYYREGLRLHLAGLNSRFEAVSMSRFPGLLRPMRRVRDAYRLRPLFSKAGWLASAMDALGRQLEGELRSPANSFHDGTGQYLIAAAASGREYKICIDSSDYGELRNKDLVVWSDIYFKTNFWPSLRYPSHVAPMVNGDPMVMPQLDTFRSYRNMEKQYDLCFIVRVWGGTRDVSEGVEHNIRLLEAVARAHCRKFLFAYLVAGDIKEYGRRLTAQGIPWSTEPMPAKDLWKVTAQSRLNIIRLGMHYCIPWRLTGALALGSCVVLDRVPFTLWPQPLLRDTNYLSLDVETAPEQTLAEEHQYAAVPERLERWLDDAEMIEAITARNGAYFDQHLHPERVGAQIMRSVESLNIDS
jgi:hypothetical protein